MVIVINEYFPLFAVMGEDAGQMMVYNEDRTVHGFISSDAKGQCAFI